MVHLGSLGPLLRETLGLGRASGVGALDADTRPGHVLNAYSDMFVGSYTYLFSGSYTAPTVFEAGRLLDLLRVLVR